MSTATYFQHTVFSLEAEVKCNNTSIVEVIAEAERDDWTKVEAKTNRDIIEEPSGHAEVDNTVGLQPNKDILYHTVEAETLDTKIETTESSNSDNNNNTLLWDEALSSLNSSENDDLNNSTNKYMNVNSEELETTADNVENKLNTSVLEVFAENIANQESIETETALETVQSK